VDDAAIQERLKALKAERKMLERAVNLEAYSGQLEHLAEHLKSMKFAHPDHWMFREI